MLHSDIALFTLYCLLYNLKEDYDENLTNLSYFDGNNLESSPQIESSDMYSREMFEENLIEEVKKYEFIYNSTHPEYKLRSKKENIWVTIASSLGNTVQQCRQRWKALRAAYQKILLRSNDGEEYTSQWKYLDAMSFMKDHLDLKPKTCLETPDDDFYAEKLIEEVKKYECVYNNAHPDHWKKSVKVEVWSLIAAAVGKTVRQCKTRWYSLRERYLRGYLKMTSGNVDEEDAPKWKYNKEMSFMKDYIQPKFSEISQKDKFCRACMGQVLNETDEQCSKSYNIFQTLDLADKLTSCSNLQITSWDEYPHSVCEKCYGQILDFHQFQIMCRDSLDKFNEIQKDQTQVKCENDLEETPGKAQIKIKCENYLEIIHDSDPLNEDISLDSVLEENESCEQEATTHCDEYKGEAAKVEIVKLEKNQLKVDDDTLEDPTDNEEPVSEDIDKSDVKGKSRDKVLLKCDICPKTFIVQHCFEAHQRRHQGLSGYPCTYANCDRAYNRVTDLTRHLNEHKGISAFKCDIDNCDQVFTQYNRLKYHKRKEHNCGKEIIKTKKKKSDKSPKSFVCETCGKVFKTKFLLQNHRLTHVNESQWPFVCDVEGCSRRFRMKYPLKIHMKRHAGIKKFVCPHCGMRKVTRNELNIHINYHTFERKYPCRICAKVFNSVGRVSEHIHKVHEEQKPRSYPCRFCDRQLSTLQNRKNHEKSHTGEGLLACEECGKTFTSPQRLKMHMNLHFRKRYACEECGKRFTYPGDLRSHKKLHIESKPYSCEECGQGFRWPGSYYRHKKKHLMDKRKDKAQEEIQTDEDNLETPAEESDLLEIVT